MELSAVIITFNEERNIARCLASLKDVADDIVVVDSYSTDATERIAREHGARFVQHKFEGHIEQKNWAITQARYPWVLSLDADEALDPVLQAEVLRVKHGAQADGYTMNRLTNYCGRWIRHGGWYPDTKLRLWDSRKGKWGGTNPHDRFELDPGARIAHLKGHLLHYSFYTVAEHGRQVEKFAAIAAKAAHAKGKRPGPLQAVFSPVWRFVHGYLIRGGFLDGGAGFTIARLSARAKRLKYTELARLNRKRP
ncbi:MAG: glycosyltransferase family 2 protein [Flavobacteriales bacterium]|nr:glycosyltransferase family 2 protein [Flavobacteriales bacterium]